MNLELLISITGLWLGILKNIVDRFIRFGFVLRHVRNSMPFFYVYIRGMIKAFLLFTVLLIFACSPIHENLVVRQVIGYWKDERTGHKYHFREGGELDYFVRLTKYKRRWERHTTNFNNQTQIYIAVYDSAYEHIETYIPIFEGSDTLRMDGLLGNDLFLTRIE